MRQKRMRTIRDIAGESSFIGHKQNTQ
jgi:hypothetical protein